MKLTKIMLVGGGGNIVLNIDNAQLSDEYHFRGADGLGPTKVDVTLAGGVLQSRLAQDREIVIRIGLNPDYSENQTVAELREQVYSLLSGPYDAKTTVVLYDGQFPLCYADGYTSDVAVVLFEDDPIVQVTIPCKDSFFRAFQEENLTDLDTNIFSVDNVGNEVTGFEMAIQFNTAMTSWKLTDMVSGEYMQFVHSFLSGDELRFGTQKRERYIRLIREGVETNLVGSLTAGSDWLTLTDRLNSFQTSEPYFNFLTFKYIPKYLGV